MAKKYTTYDTIDVKYSRGKSLVETLVAAIDKYGIDNVELVAEAEHSYGDTWVVCYLKCTRPMTASEKEEAVQKEKKAEEDRKRYELALYKKLKEQYD